MKEACRRGETNNIFFMFDEPITLSLIKIWNYRKVFFSKSQVLLLT